MVEVYDSDTGDYIIRLAFPFPILLELITWSNLWFHMDAILREQNRRDELLTSFLDVPDFCNIIVIFSVFLIIFILLLYPLRLYVLNQALFLFVREIKVEVPPYFE